MKIQLPPETLYRVIQLLKHSDYSYRKIAADAGCSTTLVQQIADGDVPNWFLTLLEENSAELLDTSVVCPHCSGRVQMWGLERARRVANRLAVTLHRKGRKNDEFPNDE